MLWLVHLLVVHLNAERTAPNYVACIYARAKKIAHKILSDPFPSLNNDLSKCPSQTVTRSTFRPIYFGINISRNSTYLARIPT